MSKDKSDQDRIGELETVVLQQGEQLTDALSTIKALKAMLSERIEAKLEPAQQRNREQEMEARTAEWCKKQDEFQAAQKKAAEAGEFKFMVCVFARSAEHDQLVQIKQAKGPDAAPWDCGVLPTHPWRLIGVDASDLETARLKAADKYNKVQGVRRLSGDVTHTIYQVDANGKPVNLQPDQEQFRRQIAETVLVEQIAA